MLDTRPTYSIVVVFSLFLKFCFCYLLFNSRNYLVSDSRLDKKNFLILVMVFSFYTLSNFNFISLFFIFCFCFINNFTKKKKKITKRQPTIGQSKKSKIKRNIFCCVLYFVSVKSIWLPIEFYYIILLLLFHI